MRPYFVVWQWLLASEHGEGRDGNPTTSLCADLDVEMDDASDLTVAQEAIEEALAELSQVGIAIRKSATPTETIHARRFAAEHLDLTTFEILAFQTVETLYPNAPEELQAQLAKSMVDRYSRLLYRATRCNILGTDSRKESAALKQPLNLTPSGVQAKKTIAKHGKTRPTANLKLSDGEVAAPPVFTLTSLDSKSVRNRLNRLRLSRSRAGATTAILGDTHDPPIPQYQSTTGSNPSATCEWCFASIPPTFVQDGHWTPIGR